MSEDNKFLAISNEIAALKEQQKQNLEDYRVKYSKLDAEYRTLEVKKLSLTDEIKALGNKVDESKNAITVETAKASGIVSAAKADAESIVEEARVKANSLIELANEIKSDAENVLAANNAQIDDAIKREKQADEAVRKADASRLDAEIILGEANKKAQDAITAQANAEKVIATAEVKRKALEAYEAELNERFKAVKEEETLLSGKKQAIKDESDALASNKKQFADDCAIAVADIDAKKAEAEQIRAGLIDQKERNKFKDAELDAGYSKLKKDQDELKKAQKVVEAVKKELVK